MSLSGKTAFITGGGKNIGRCIALNLAASGANVVVNGASDQAACDTTAADVRKAGVEAMVLIGDVGDSDTVSGMAKLALD